MRAHFCSNILWSMWRDEFHWVSAACTMVSTRRPISYWIAWNLCSPWTEWLKCMAHRFNFARMSPTILWATKPSLMTSCRGIYWCALNTFVVAKLNRLHTETDDVEKSWWGNDGSRMASVTIRPEHASNWSARLSCSTSHLYWSSLYQILSQMATPTAKHTFTGTIIYYFGSLYMYNTSGHIGGINDDTNV